MLGASPRRDSPSQESAAGLRYRILHTAARLTRGERHRWPRIPATWNTAGDERLVTDDLDQLLPALASVAESLGCSAQLANLRDIVDCGASYQRQLRIAAANGGSLKAVVSSLVRELRDGRPN